MLTVPLAKILIAKPCALCVLLEKRCVLCRRLGTLVEIVECNKCVSCHVHCFKLSTEGCDEVIPARKWGSCIVKLVDNRGGPECCFAGEESEARRYPLIDTGLVDRVRDLLTVDYSRNLCCRAKALFFCLRSDDECAQKLASIVCSLAIVRSWLLNVILSTRRSGDSGVDGWRVLGCNGGDLSGEICNLQREVSNNILECLRHCFRRICLDQVCDQRRSCLRWNVGFNSWRSCGLKVTAGR